MNPELNGVEQAPAIEHESAIKRAARFAGKNLLKGLFIGVGFTVPAVLGGAYLLNLGEESLKSTKDEFITDGGHKLTQWSDDLSEHKLSKIEGPLVTLSEVFPKPPETTTTTTIQRSPADELAIALGVDPSVSTTTTTTVPPQE